MNPFKSYLLIGALFLFLSACRDEAPVINNVEEFDEYVQDEMTAQDIPALSVLVFREGEVLHERLFGEANLSNGTALTGDHLFLLASVSKVVTGVALLQLHEAGHFQLDDPINDHLPGESARL